MNEEVKKKYRIGWFSAFILLLLAGTADFISVIPFIGDAFWVFMAGYLWKTGHGLLNIKRLISGVSSIVIESVPFLSALPSILVATMLIIGFSRIEDKTGISLESSAGIRKPNIKMPLNKDGTRLPRKENMVELEQ